MRIGQMISGNVFGLSIVMLASLTWSGGAGAVEFNSMRIGDDYRIFKLPIGSSWRDCEDECKKDGRCESWSYIKERIATKEGIKFNLGPGFSINLGGRDKIIPAQCRMKRTVTRAIANKCCVTGVVIAKRPEPRTRRERCDAYAERAVEQYEKNLIDRCGYRGGRWQGDYNSHFDWCMRSKPRQVRSERVARRDALNNCRDQRPVRNTACDRYAQVALRQNESNTKNRCGFKGARWHSNFERYYDWCLNARPRQRNREASQRRSDVAACLTRGGGAYVARCDNYAVTAIDQNRRNASRGCGLSGRLWSDSYKVHYQWCLSQNARRATRRTDRRQRLLRRECSRRFVQKRRQCNQFAGKAIELQQQNRNERCGFTERRWREPFDTHFEWCMGASAAERTREQRKREGAIEVCLARGGGPVNRQCEDYADRAISQFRRGETLGCGFSGARWNADRRLHYRWCADASSWRRNRETSARKRALDRCDRRLGESRRVCERYSNAAVDQARTNRDERCGFTGTRWSLNRSTHLDWCQRARAGQREDEMIGRKRKLEECVTRGGGRYNDACDRYASDAVQQARRNRDRRCGFAGARWSDNYRAHYQWCIKAGPRKARRETRDRLSQISSCRSRTGRKLNECRQYARLSVNQITASRQNRCAFKGRRWSGAFDFHLNWCMDATRQQRDRETSVRQDAINSCVARGGGAVNERCKRYASTAVKQNRENVQRRCGYRGGRWSDAYKSHYRWCQKVSDRKTNQETAIRKQALRTLCGRTPRRRRSSGDREGSAP